MGRAPCCDKANVKKGPWSPEEDSKLKEYIEKHGTGGNWIALPQKAGLRRCGKSCRLRWLNYLRPNIKHGEFSDEEDRIICTLYANIGSRWSIIAAQLPGRTDNDIKNYWNTKLKKKLMGLLPSSHLRKLPYQSSPQNPPFPSHYYNNSASNTSFSTGLVEPISVASTSSCYNTNTSTTTTTTSISHLPFYQNQESSLVSSGIISPMQMQYYPINTESLLMFGSEGSCSTSSDGSCSQVSSLGIKQEEMMGFQNFMYSSNSNSNNKFMFSHSSIDNDGGHYVNQLEAEKSSKECFSQTQSTPLDYDLEVIKQLISSNSSSSSYCNNNNNNNNNNNGYLSIDENKTEEGEEKRMYYYYY